MPAVTVAVCPSIVAEITGSVLVKVAVTVLPSTAKVEPTESFEVSDAITTDGETVSTITEPESVDVVELPAELVATTTTSAAPCLLPLATTRVAV